MHICISRYSKRFTKLSFARFCEKTAPLPENGRKFNDTVGVALNYDLKK